MEERKLEELAMFDNLWATRFAALARKVLFFGQDASQPYAPKTSPDSYSLVIQPIFENNTKLSNYSFE